MGDLKVNWDPKAQAAKGVASGVARRARVKERDAKIRVLAAQGWTQRAIAQEVGLTQATVYYVLKRGY